MNFSICNSLELRLRRPFPITGRARFSALPGGFLLHAENSSSPHINFAKENKMPSLVVKRLELQDEIDVPPEIYNWFVPQNYAVSFYQRYTDPKNVILMDC